MLNLIPVFVEDHPYGLVLVVVSWAQHVVLVDVLHGRARGGVDEVVHAVFVGNHLVTLIDDILEGPTEISFIMRSRFGEVCSCSSLTVLLGPAWVLLNYVCAE